MKGRDLRLDTSNSGPYKSHNRIMITAAAAGGYGTTTNWTAGKEGHTRDAIYNFQMPDEPDGLVQRVGGDAEGS